MSATTNLISAYILYTRRNTPFFNTVPDTKLKEVKGCRHGFFPLDIFSLSRQHENYSGTTIRQNGKKKQKIEKQLGY
jgi:hypothetical protein